ncbi:MAG: Gldg family protein [Nitrospirae bacterium]|nr:Gldg family protein [Nitrospirota bacterium]
MKGRFFPIFQRELQVLFYSPVAYLVMTAFLVISGYYFYTLFTVYSIQSFQAAQTTSLAQALNLIDGVTRPLFLQMGIVCLLLLPLLTMRLFAEERKTGTLDLLLTYPVREIEVVLAKYAAAAVVFLGMTALTYPFPLMLFYYADLDPGAIVAGYLGLLLMGGAFLALGLFFSAVTEHQIIAAVTTFGILFLSWLLGSATDFLSGGSGRVLGQFSILAHQRSFAKGVVETPDLLFYLLIIGAALFLTWYLLGTRWWGGWLRGPVAGLAAVIVGVVALQTLAAFFPIRADLTEARRFTLSDATLKVLRGLDRDVQVTAFAKKGSPYQKRLEDLLTLYGYTTSHWKFNLVDPDKNPSLAEKYGVSGFGVLVVIAGEGRESRAKLPFEEEITGALLKVTQQEKKALCFVTGHGEHDFRDPSKVGYLSVREELVKNGYEPRAVSLASAEAVSDCALVAAAGSRGAWLPGEMEVLNRWLDGVKPVFLLLEPNGSPELRRLVEDRYRLTAETGVVVDRTSKVFGGEYQMPVATRYGTHRTTQGFTLNTFYPTALALRLPEKPPVGMTPLVQTGAESWVEKDRGELERGAPDQDAPREPGGPLVLAVAGISGNIDLGETARWAVLGDSDFAANAYFGLAGNGRFFMNLINWLAEDEAMILAGSEENTAPQPVFLTSAQARIVFFLTVVLFPAILVGIGGYVGRRRWL